MKNAAKFIIADLLSAIEKDGFKRRGKPNTYCKFGRYKLDLYAIGDEIVYSEEETENLQQLE